MPNRLYWPIDKVFITQKFGENPSHYAKYGMNGHNGIDFRTRFIDSPLGHRYITAADDAVVSEVNAAAPTVGYGIFVRLAHPDGSQTIYGHLAKPYVGTNQHVKAGERIGLSDNTGDSSGPHLHFGYRAPDWKNCYSNGFKGYIDPLQLFVPLPGVTSIISVA